MNSRIKKFYSILERLNFDGMLVSWPANITYLTGYRSRDSYLLVSRKGNFYFTDSRYSEEAKPELKGVASLLKINGSVFSLIAQTCLDFKLKAVACEGRYLPYAEYKKISDCLKKKAKLISTHSLIEQARQIKDPQEIGKIKKAVEVAASALKFIRGFIKPGIKEIEVEAELERFIRYHGADNSSFDIIVASGQNCAYPHHITSERKIRNNEPVLIDMGADYQGYKSDLTRVFFLGKINLLAQEIYAIVKEAQARALKNIRPGAKAADIDRVARDFLTEKGYARFFGHNLGHGVGLDVHEEPHLSPKSNQVLEPGMVITVEPGIYIAGKLGVRVEDMVLVTEKGYEVLSGSVSK